MTHSIHGTFVSEKINKIRWRPDLMNDCNFFVTGSWDNDQNSIKLWEFQENEEEADIYPILISEYPHLGDVTEIKFLDADNFIASSSTGSVKSFTISTEHGCDPIITCNISWEKIHKFFNTAPAPCTALSVYDRDIVTVGEDGAVNLLNAQNRVVLRTIDNADSCSIHCVVFLKHSEILTGNLRGQLKIWDVRAGSSDPASTFILSGEQVTPTCLQYHPTQRHLVVAGDEEGSITIWDLRHSTHPSNLLKAHKGSIAEIQFHPEHPDQLFSASGAGDIWQWAPKSANLSSGSESNVWLSADAIQSKLEVFTLMPKLHKPINSLDLNRGKVISGCDNEAIYLINGVNVYKSGYNFM